MAESLPVKKSIDTPLGGMWLAATSQGLCGAWFEGQKHFPAMDAWPEMISNPHLLTAERALDAYFMKATPIRGLSLDLSAGTDFQQAVWKALSSLSYGHWQSYGQLAAKIDRPDAVRAVAGAVGRNPLSIIIPCHRILGRDASLTGYAGGLDRKKYLLGLEGISYRAGV